MEYTHRRVTGRRSLMRQWRDLIREHRFIDNRDQLADMLGGVLGCLCLALVVRIGAAAF